MKRKLLLILRHGKSDWTTGLEDYHRPLVGRGRKGARKMGAWIRHLDLIPDAVLSSPAARARAYPSPVLPVCGYDMPPAQIATASAGIPSPHSTTGLPRPACGTSVRSQVSMSIDTRPSIRLRCPATRIGVPFGA